MNWTIGNPWWDQKNEYLIITVEHDFDRTSEISISMKYLAEKLKPYLDETKVQNTQEKKNNYSR